MASATSVSIAFWQATNMATGYWTHGAISLNATVLHLLAKWPTAHIATFDFRFHRFAPLCGYFSLARHVGQIMQSHSSSSGFSRPTRRQNEYKNIPIIMLTAKGEEADKLRGLNSGADDYITKPFSPAEVVARMRAVLRRAQPQNLSETLSYRDIILDTTTYRVTRATQDIHLGPTEFRLLRHFMENPHRVFSREQLLDAVWGQNVYVEVRTVDVHIRRLRKAINIEGTEDVIRTVRSAGYALDYKEGF